MFPSRSSTQAREERPPGPRIRRRRLPFFRPLLGLGLCTLAACALFSPGLVFGAEAEVEPSDTTAQMSPAAKTGPILPEPSAGELLVTLPWGSGEGQVGLDSPGEGLTRGPEAVAVAPNGRIAVLDSVNRRVVVLDAAGQYVGAISVELAEPRFLAVTDERLYLLDCDADRRLLSMGWSGEMVTLSDLPSLDDVVTGLFATDAGPCVEVAHDQTFLVGEPGSAAGVGPHGQKQAGKAALRSLPGRPMGRALGLVAKVTFRQGDGCRSSRSDRPRQPPRHADGGSASPTSADWTLAPGVRLRRRPRRPHLRRRLLAQTRRGSGLALALVRAGATALARPRVLPDLAPSPTSASRTASRPTAASSGPSRTRAGTA